MNILEAYRSAPVTLRKYDEYLHEYLLDGKEAF